MSSSGAHIAAFATGGGHPLSTGWILLLAIGIPVLVLTIITTVFWFTLIGPSRRSRSLLATGVPATGVIRRVHTSNTRVGASRFVVPVDVELRAPDGRLITTRTRTMLDVVRQGPIRENTTVPLRVDPRDPTRVAIDWAAAAPGGDTAPPQSSIFS
ncbi:MAG: hypothetical protein U0Y82_03865 [Thermoleophilia bacterium]